MITGEIIFTLGSEAGPDDTFTVVIASQKIETTVSFHVHAALWKEFGKQLINFPTTPDERLVFDTSHQGAHPAALRLEAYCYDYQGSTALRIVADNHAAYLQRVKLDFSLSAEVSSLNHLGRMLANWQPEILPEITWQAQVS